MPSWEDMKRAGQTAFTMAGNGFQDVYGSVGSAYQQILLTGHLQTQIGRDSLTQQITGDAFKLNPEYAAADRSYQAQEEERERNEDISKHWEPER